MPHSSSSSVMQAIWICPPRFSRIGSPRSRKVASCAELLVAVLNRAITALAASPRDASETKILLHRNWEIQSSCQVKAEGKEISTTAFRTLGWHHAEVPTTVVAALVADKTYPDPFFGKNLKSFPGMDYPRTEFFANQPMPDDSPFRCSWWFRTEFQTPASLHDATTWLHFDGINYRANVWLNGQKIADAQETAGTFRRFEFDVSKQF